MLGPQDRQEGDARPSNALAGRRRAAQSSPWALAGAGMELAAVIGVLTWFGWWLDTKWHTTPWLMFLCLMVGLIGGTYNVWRVARRFFDDL